MRRIFGIMLIVMVAMMSTACVEEVIDSTIKEDQSAEKVQMTFSAVSGADTKLTLSDKTKILWEPGDGILVNGDNFNATLEEPSNYSEFVGTTVPAEEYHAISSNLNLQWDGKEYTFMLQGQRAVNDNLPIFLSAAKCTDSEHSLNFRNLLCYVKFTIPEGLCNKLSYLQIDAKGREPMRRPAVIDFSGKRPMLTLKESDYRAISLSIMPTTPGDYYIALYPGTYSRGLMFTFLSEDGKIAIKEISQEVVLESGTIKNIGTVSDTWWKEFENQLDVEREALIEFYNATGGDKWKNNTNWCSDKPVNEWYGVSTDWCGQVNGLYLYDNALIGYIPEDIGKLSKLKEIRLGYNYLSGPIPESICNLEDLEQLKLENNRLSGQIPENIGNLELLEVFELGNYSMRVGEVVDFLEPIPESEMINHLSGDIPKSIGKLQNLKTFSAICNNLTGDIPDELWEIPSLENVKLSGNLLTGELSSAIRNAKNLKRLWLDNNCMEGRLPNEICELSNIEELILGNAGRSIGGKVYDWDTTYNKFEGTLPQDISRLCNLRQLNLACCKFSGEIPVGLWNIQTLESVSLNCNFFNGELSPSVGQAKKLTYLGLSNNQLVGIIPNEICGLLNLNTIDIMNCIGVNGRNINPELQFNMIEGEIPEEIGKLSNLQCFLARSNNLTGKFPEFFAFNPIMEGSTPILYGNRMSGRISYDIINSNNWKSWNISEILQQQDGSVFSLDYSNGYSSTDYSQDGKVKQLQTATEGNGIDIVLMGDAYTDRLIADGTYDNVMIEAMEKFFEKEPFKSFRNHFNVYSVTVVSKNEVYDIDSSTALECEFGEGSYVTGNHNKVFSYALKAIDEKRMDEAVLMVLMNSKEYAGTCHMFNPKNGDYGSGVSIAYFPIGVDDNMLGQLVQHEAAGHGFSKLGDEYYYSGTITKMEIEEAENQSRFGWWKNIDFISNPFEVKWAHFLSDDRYAFDGIGVYEGAFTYSYGAYRPTENSIMNTNVGEFNAPSREAIYYRIHKLSYGENWEYDYEKFVEWDTINRTTETRSMEVPYFFETSTEFEQTHRPSIVGLSWKDVMKNDSPKVPHTSSGNIQTKYTTNNQSAAKLINVISYDGCSINTAIYSDDRNIR